MTEDAWETPCQALGCYHCCKGTEMTLSERDLARIAQAGHDPADFSLEVDGYLQLRNRAGLCWFHDGTRCTIYPHRPDGCRTYPVIYLDHLEGVIDEDCLYPERFEMRPDKVILITEAVEMQDAERLVRLARQGQSR